MGSSCQQAGKGSGAFASQCLILSAWAQQSLLLQSLALARDVLLQLGPAKKRRASHGSLSAQAWREGPMPRAMGRVPLSQEVAWEWFPSEQSPR